MKWQGKQLRGVTQWEVWHPDFGAYGLPTPRYGSLMEARHRAREWNKDIPGHTVRPVLPKETP
jgi:hypothetical protein